MTQREEREIKRGGGREKGKEGDRESKTKRDRQINRERETNRQTERERIYHHSLVTCQNLPPQQVPG